MALTRGLFPSDINNWPLEYTFGYSSLQDAINGAIAANKPLGVCGGSFDITSTLTALGDVELVILAPTTITATSAMVSMLSCSGALKITGERLTLDGGGLVTGNGIYCSAQLPHIETVTVQNMTGANGFLGNALETGLGSGLPGDGYLKNCRAIDTNFGFRFYGRSVPKDATMVLENCSTDGQQGATGGAFANVYYLQGFAKASVNGGEWLSDDNTRSNGPNLYLCDSGEIIGGSYKNLERGPTVGQSTKNFRIIGTFSEDCLFAGVSADLKTGGGAFPDGYGLIEGNVVRQNGVGFGVYIQAAKVSVIGNEIDSPATTGIRINGGTEHWIDSNVFRGIGASKLSIQCSQNAAARLGKNKTDGTNQYTYSVGASTEILEFGNFKSVSANADLNLADDVIIVDASSGPVDLDLPRLSTGNSRGKIFDVIRTDNSANNITFTLDAGDGTVNGTTVVVWAGPNQYGRKKVYSIGGGTYIVS